MPSSPSSNKFNEQYFKTLWNTVHRHDYTKDLAAYLISIYGKVRFLDIGTGCGNLIMELRKQGAEAWGLEVSDYAIENSDCPEFMRKGDVRNIPWAADSFDVIHSQGLWEYIPKEDIQQAWTECKRVGKIQHHNIDYKEGLTGNEQAVTAESEQWWKDQFYPKILIACPNHEIKEYSFQRWIDNVKSFTYPNFDILVVDNTPTEDFYNRWKDKVPMVHIQVPQDSPEARINYSMEAIRQRFINGNYFRWFNIESDIIPPQDIIEKMMPFAEKLDWMAHGYSDRNANTDAEVMQGIGCCMFSKDMIQHFNFHNAGGNYTADGWLWGLVRPLNKYRVVEMWGTWPIKHLRE